MSHHGLVPTDPGTGEPAALREVMARFATGITVLTVGGESIHGMTANAFSSVSLDPPLVLCCIAHSAEMHKAITAGGHFGVSVMADDQEELVRYFADKQRPLGPAQFEAVDWLPGRTTGAPLLRGALAWLECEVVEAHDSGDHSIFIGAVRSSSRVAGGSALLFADGRFERIGDRAAVR